MDDVVDVVAWLAATPEHRLVPLFGTATDDPLAVVVRHVGAAQRPVLSRSAAMEAAVIELVERGLADERWEGLLYVMGWGQSTAFRPLYVGKAERRGVRNALSVNLVNLRHRRQFFARWGDNLAYHIGDLSQALFESAGYRSVQHKYRRWAECLFTAYRPPRLREPVWLYLVPWYVGSIGPSGLRGSLPAVEKEVIALAAAQFAGLLLNVDGR